MNNKIEYAKIQSMFLDNDFCIKLASHVLKLKSDKECKKIVKEVADAIATIDDDYNTRERGEVFEYYDNLCRNFKRYPIEVIKFFEKDHYSVSLTLVQDPCLFRFLKYVRIPVRDPYESINILIVPTISYNYIELLQKIHELRGSIESKERTVIVYNEIEEVKAITLTQEKIKEIFKISDVALLSVGEVVETDVSEFITYE